MQQGVECTQRKQDVYQIEWVFCRMRDVFLELHVTVCLGRAWGGAAHCYRLDCIHSVLERRQMVGSPRSGEYANVIVLLFCASTFPTVTDHYSSSTGVERNKFKVETVRVRFVAFGIASPGIVLGGCVAYCRVSCFDSRG